jgi:hypothetical protein
LAGEVKRKGSGRMADQSGEYGQPPRGGKWKIAWGYIRESIGTLVREEEEESEVVT